MMTIIANRFQTELDSNPLDPFGLGRRDGHTQKSTTTAEELVFQLTDNRQHLPVTICRQNLSSKKIKIERLYYTFLSDVKVI
jgi:hypothetical protein